MDRNEVTEDDLLDELQELYGRETRQPGDIDHAQIAQRLNISVWSAKQRMVALVAQGLWEKHLVATHIGGPLTVYRKKAKK